MEPQARRKVLVVTAVSLGILAFSFLIPAFIIPIYKNMSQSGACTDVNCAQFAYEKCQAAKGINDGSSGSGNFLDMWVEGMDGMLCMMGISGSGTLFYYHFAEEMRKPASGNDNDYRYYHV